jgi:hypothetical protein
MLHAVIDRSRRIEAITTFSTPAPMRNPLIQPLLILFVTPSMILANPSNMSAKCSGTLLRSYIQGIFLSLNFLS